MNEEEIILQEEGEYTINLGEQPIIIGGTSNYNDLENKPQINGVTLEGDKSTADLGIDLEYAYDASWLVFEETATQEEIAELTDAIETQKVLYYYDGERYFTADYMYLDVEENTISVVFSLPYSGSNIGFYAITAVVDITTGTITQEYADADWTEKQNRYDTSLDTTQKFITSAINEVNNIAKGANQAISFASYSAMVTAVNNYAKTKFITGQNVMIITLDVPDLWVSSVENTSVTYTYTTDAAFVQALETDGYVQVGYFKLSALETQKVDLTNYVDLTSAQTITGAKTFSSAITTADTLSFTNNGAIKRANSTKMLIESGNITFYEVPRPSADNIKDLGTSGRKWKDVYLAGSLTDGTNTITVANIANKNNFVQITQADYDALVLAGTVDPDTFYFIEEQ